MCHNLLQLHFHAPMHLSGLLVATIKEQERKKIFSFLSIKYFLILDNNCVIVIDAMDFIIAMDLFHGLLKYFEHIFM